MIDKTVLDNIENFYLIKVLKAFEYDKKASNALKLISQELTELFNFVEPAYFDGKFIMIKELDNQPVMPIDDSSNITMNKLSLLNNPNDIVIQVFDDGKVLSWENADTSALGEIENVLIYYFENNKEKFIANKEEVDITKYDFGSQFSNEFVELEGYLEAYKTHKVRYSSCPILQDSWADNNRLFFKGGAKDIPESILQMSLKNFLDDVKVFKGKVGQFEPTREHNLSGSKPVDIAVRWEKSNRLALIEIKWLGKSILDGSFKSTYNNGRANEGAIQLKGYYDMARTDYPNKIIRCYLIVIDGRRWRVNEESKIINNKDGMYYANSELTLSDDRKYHETYREIKEPIRMFAEPICS